MRNPLDDALEGLGEQAQEHLAKQARKQGTTRRQIVDYTPPEGEGEGTAIVETSEDGTRSFVKICLHDGYTGTKTVVSVCDGSRDGALRKAEEKFEQLGSITLLWPADES